MKGIASLMSIGQFSQQSRLSLKALRLYDRLGLLRPDRVDLETGYRYYAAEQLSRARRIALLRRLEMPLGLIQQVLDASGREALNLVERYWQEVEERTAQGRRVVDYLRIILRGEDPMGLLVETREVPSRQALSILGEVYVKDLPGFIDEGFRTLYGYLESRGARSAGHGLVIYHGEVNDDSNGPVEVVVPVVPDSVPAGERMQLVELPAGREAYTTIMLRECRFPEILKAYDAVAGWIKRHGHTMAGDPREIYFAEPVNTGPDDPFCDVAWPYR